MREKRALLCLEGEDSTSGKACSSDDGRESDGHADGSVRATRART